MAYVTSPRTRLSKPIKASVVSLRKAKIIIQREASIKISWKSGNRGVRKVYSCLLLSRKINTPVTTSREDMLNSTPQ